MGGAARGRGGAPFTASAGVLKRSAKGSHALLDPFQAVSTLSQATARFPKETGRFEYGAPAPQIFNIRLGHAGRRVGATLRRMRYLSSKTVPIGAKTEFLTECDGAHLATWRNPIGCTILHET